MPREDKVSVIVKNGDKFVVKFIGTIRTKLNLVVLDLQDVYCVLSIRKNLVSIGNLLRRSLNFQ